MPRAVPRSRGYPQIAQGAMGHISTRECRLLRNRLFSCTFHDENEKITCNSKKQTKRQNKLYGTFPFILEKENVCIPWRLILEETECKMELSGSYINLHNSSRKLFSEEIFVQRHLLCMQQFHSISHNSGRNVYPCEFEIPVCIINTCVLSERIKHEIALCKGIKPWIPDSRCWIPLFVSRA